jgi:hypothetical protein
VDTIAGWPHWEVTFGRDGESDAGRQDALLRELAGAGLTDLVVFAHGWNNSRGGAQDFYRRFLGQLPGLLPAGSAARVGTLGVFWPSMLWPDESTPDFAGGAAGLAGNPVRAVQAFYDDPDQQKILDRLATLLEEEPNDEAALAEFHDLMRQLAGTEQGVAAAEDDGPLQMLADDPRTVAQRFASAVDVAGAGAGPGEPGPDEGGAAALTDAGPVDDDAAGAAGFRDVTHRIWNGAKEALRQLTYYQMKNRAGAVGERGLGGLVRDLHGRQPTLRVHLVGHSFGARLVSFALRGAAAGPGSPVKSVVLLEGAFSHFAFAPALPFDRNRGGVLAGMLGRVDGPLVACFSRHDSAVGTLYPLASRASGSDAAGLIEELRVRWGAIGFDGAQAVGAASDTLRAAGSRYSLARGGFTNVDGTAVIATGSPPSGAHSDIHHQEVAWLVLSAAGLGAP